MINADISRAYELLQKVAASAKVCSSSQIGELTSAAASGNSGLSESFVAFESALKRAEMAFDAVDDDDLAAELINLRLIAMNVVADFDNLVDAISDLFERGSVRTEAGKSGSEKISD